MCSERMRLLTDYREATHVYAESVRYLTEPALTEIQGDAELLRRACRRAWENAERTRVALIRHEECRFCRRMRLAS